ncbi:MAG: hypothetical protein CVV27_04225 [Candidatus Melainabacteria bacterium HGW-Melainabacteria-1]|nr:MAG: hypothetical protein CVV27_04225 [Candidatus Melainabacteria bacterium HGW-Melainabacteria-1]
MRKSFVIQYEVNDACNLRCSHCYHGLKVVKESPVTLQRLFEDIEPLKQHLGPDYDITICLSGGEALLRKDLLDLVLQISLKGYASFVLTNGTLVKPDTAAGLKLFGVKIARISFDGGTAEIHDAIRGKGQFDKALAGVRTLRASGLDVQLSHTLMMHHNDAPEQLEALFEMARREGIGKLNIFRMFGQGDAKDTPEYGFSDAKRFKAVLENLWDLAERYADLQVVIKDPLAKNLNRPLPPNLKIDVCCFIKQDHLTVAASGKVYACRKLETHVGDIFSDTLLGIWQNSKLLQQLADRRQYMTGKCRSCKINDQCQGGCLAASYGQYRELFIPDPACWLEETDAETPVAAKVALT